MERKALGKGLDALLPSAPNEEATPGLPVRNVPLREIRPNPYQVRGEMTTEGLRELAESVRTHGILQPLVVRRQGNGYELVAGERRFRAAEMAGLEQVPVVVRECTNQQMLELALIENLQREDINAMDAAQAFHRLIEEFGLSQEEVAARVGKSRSAVANTLRLLNLPPSLQQRVRMGQLSEGHARALLALGAMPEVQLALADRILAEQLSVRDAERLVRQSLEHTPRHPEEMRPRRDPHLANIEERLQHRFGTRVTITRMGNRGAIRIEFYDPEQLEQILEMLMAP